MNAKVSIQCVVAGISRIDSRARNWWNKSATSLWRCALSGQRLGLLHRERKRKSGDEFTAIRMLSWGATQSSIKRSLRFVVFARSLLDQLLRLAPTEHIRCPFATPPYEVSSAARAAQQLIEQRARKRIEISSKWRIHCHYDSASSISKLKTVEHVIFFITR